jgi:hypothetical protein
VDEQRRAARAAGVEVAGGTRPGVHLAPVALEAFQHGGHGFGNEVALMIARADDPAAVLSAGESAVAEFLDRLLGDG